MARVALVIAILALILSAGNLIWQGWPAKEAGVADSPKTRQSQEDRRFERLSDKIDCVAERAASSLLDILPC